MYPEVQQKAQLELDAIVGSDRLPDFSDRPSLPYFNALMKELYRWHVVTPIGLPHLSIADDEFQGYCIPAGSVVFPNVWYVSADVPNWAGQISVEFVDQRLSYRAMSRDNNRYPDPETFKPERFLDPSGKLNLSAGDPEDYIFGFGRRCVLSLSIRRIVLSGVSLRALRTGFVPGGTSLTRRSSLYVLPSSMRSTLSLQWTNTTFLWN